jgi:glycosyltransferase involved in cell wall biosynthesis
MTGQNIPQPAISVIIPVCERYANAGELWAEYTRSLDTVGKDYELIFVLDGPHEAFARELESLPTGGRRVTEVSLTRSFGEATALMAGFEHAAGEIVMTLPAYHQVDGSDIVKLLDALQDCDFATARRWPRSGGPFERFRRWVFHGLLARVTGLRFSDLGCGARAFDRKVLEEVQLYGEQHRLFAVLADRQGFRVREVDLRQSPLDRFDGFYRPRAYARGFLDIFTVFFLVRFTKKPLRFFGMLGVSMFVLGAVLLAWLIFERLVFGEGLTERPALLLSSLILVVGLQLFALGLLGELIIYTHARSIKDYQVERVFQFPERKLSLHPVSKPEDLAAFSESGVS